MSQARTAAGHANAAARDLSGAARHAPMLPARRQWWRMSPHTSSVLRPTRSRPRVRRRLTAGLKKLVALSANGSVHNFRAKSGISCLTTRSCATKSVGSYSIVDRLAQITPSAQQSVHPTSGILRDLGFSAAETLTYLNRLHQSRGRDGWPESGWQASVVEGL